MAERQGTSGQWRRGAVCREAVEVAVWVWGVQSCRLCVAAGAFRRRRPRRRSAAVEEEDVGEVGEVKEAGRRTSRAVRVRSPLRPAGTARRCTRRLRPFSNLRRLLRRCRLSPSRTTARFLVTTFITVTTASARDRPRGCADGRCAGCRRRQHRPRRRGKIAARPKRRSSTRSGRVSPSARITPSTGDACTASRANSTTPETTPAPPGCPSPTA